MSLPPPLQPIRCRRADCTLPEGGRCALVAQHPDPLATCPLLLRREDTQAGDRSAAGSPGSPIAVDSLRRSEETSPQGDAAPWGGRHLSLIEADRLLRRSPARVVSVLGPHDAGKTCLLASFFLQLAAGQRGSFPYRFASSRTLYGFRDLVDRANRWTGGEGDEIVGHTPREETERAGQFLHIGLRPAVGNDERHVDVLLTDVPGESFKEWSLDASDEASERVHFVHRSDAFIAVVDAAALVGHSPATMDATSSMLVRRLVGELAPRRVPRALALVFSKFDLVIDRVRPPDDADCLDRGAWGLLGRRASRIWAALDAAREAGFTVRPFAVSAFPQPLAHGQPVGVMQPFTFLMAHADRRDRWPSLGVTVPDGSSWFGAYRRWDLQS